MGICNERISIKILIFLTVLSILFSRTGSKALTKNEDVDHNLFQKILSVFEKALSFYNENYNLINFDSLLCLRVAQGSLRRILIDNTNGNLNIQESYVCHVRKMYIIAEKITEKALPLVRKDNIDQYESFTKSSETLVSFQPVSKIELAKDQDRKLMVLFQITTYLFFSKSPVQTDKVRCNVTDYCWEFETQRNLDGYSPTHQILYFLFGLGNGCENILNQMFQKTAQNNGVQDFFAETSENILRSVKNVMLDISTLGIEKDLFMEQTLYAV